MSCRKAPLVRGGIAILLAAGIVGVQATPADSINGSAVRGVQRPHDGQHPSRPLGLGPAAAIDGRLNGVASVASNNAWAVGDQFVQGEADTLVQHWLGTSWTGVSSPNPGGAKGSYLNAVVALSRANVWAVGKYDVSADGSRTLVEHWDGTQWVRVPSPKTVVGTLLAAPPRNGRA